MGRRCSSRTSDSKTYLQRLETRRRNSESITASFLTCLAWAWWQSPCKPSTDWTFVHRPGCSSRHFRPPELRVLLLLIRRRLVEGKAAAPMAVPLRWLFAIWCAVLAYSNVFFSAISVPISIFCTFRTSVGPGRAVEEIVSRDDDLLLASRMEACPYLQHPFGPVAFPTVKDSHLDLWSIGQVVSSSCCCIDFVVYRHESMCFCPDDLLQIRHLHCPCSCWFIDCSTLSYYTYLASILKKDLVFDLVAIAIRTRYFY